MSDFNRTSNFFGTKDGLISGDPDKLIVGAEIDSELNAAATAINTKYDTDSDVTLTGVTGYVSDEHVLHAGVSMTAGEGLSGGGNISSTRNFDLDIAALTTTLAVAAAAGDLVALEDITGGGTKKITVANLVLGTGFVSTSLTISTGNGIDGGGDLTSNRNLTVAGGTGLTATATGLDLDQSTDSALGGVELATQDEVNTGTDTARVITCETLAGSDFAITRTLLANFTTASTSQLGETTAIDANITKIELIFHDVRMSASGAGCQIQLGDSTGYSASSDGVNHEEGASTPFSAGPLLCWQTISSDDSRTGIITLIKVDSLTNVWVASGVLADTGASGSGFTTVVAGLIDNVQVVDRLRVVTPAFAFNATPGVVQVNVYT